MKTKEIKKLTVKELQEKFRELQNQLTKERAQVSRGTQSKNPMIIRNTRKAIAQILQMLATKREVEVTKKA